MAKVMRISLLGMSLVCFGLFPPSAVGEGPRHTRDEFTLHVEAIAFNAEMERALHDDVYSRGERFVHLSAIEAFFVRQAIAEEKNIRARPKNTLLAEQRYRYSAYTDANREPEPEPVRGVWRSTSASPFHVSLKRSYSDDSISLAIQFEREGVAEEPLHVICCDGQAVLVYESATPLADGSYRAVLMTPRFVHSTNQE